MLYDFIFLKTTAMTHNHHCSWIPLHVSCISPPSNQFGVAGIHSCGFFVWKLKTSSHLPKHSWRIIWAVQPPHKINVERDHYNITCTWDPIVSSTTRTRLWSQLTRYCPACLLIITLYRRLTRVKLLWQCNIKVAHLFASYLVSPNKVGIFGLMACYTNIREKFPADADVLCLS